MVKPLKKGNATIITLQKKKRFMKKTKILTVLGVLLAMGITACGGKTASKSASGAASGSSSAAPASGQTSGKTSSSQAPKHEHVWVEDTSAYVAPGCETEGQKTYRCTGEGTCPQNNVKTEKVAALGHDWGTAIPVAASNGGVSYNKYECQRNNKADKAVKYDIDLTGENRITLVGSSALKADSNVPGYIKLDKPNGGSFTIDFYSDAYGVGKIYQNGVMDHMSGSDTANQSKSFFSGNDTGNTHADEIGNFELKVNGEAVDFSAQTKSFGDLFPEVDDTHPAAASTYSPLAEIETGAVTVGKGLNQISFKRVDSYNIILKSFVIVFVPQEHEHTLSDTGWTQTKAPTCLPGEEAQQCPVCKATITRAIPADKDHTYGEWVQDEAPSCKAGLRHKECSICHEKFYEAIPAVTTEHTWGPKEDIPADTANGRVGYEKYVCSVCNTWKVVLKVSDGTLDKYMDGTTEKDSALKADDNALTGGWKLSKNNMSFSYKFNFETLADVKIFQRGCMDNWHGTGTNNRDKTYHSGASVSTANPSGTNFKFVVNGQDVPFDEATANAKAEDLCADREDDDPLKTVTCPSGGTGYSAYTDLLIGESQLVAGENTFKYVRLASYNYIITDIILEVTPLDHQHEAGANWVNTDPDYHWQYCSHNDGKAMNKAKHDFEKTSTTATCTAAGEATYTCKVCGYTKTAPEGMLEHNFTVGAADANGISSLTCPDCGKVGVQFDGFTGANAGNVDSDSKINKKVTFNWTVNMPKAGRVALYIAVAYSSGNGGQKFGTGYTLKAGETDGTITLGDVAYNTLIKEGLDNCTYLKYGEVDVESGDVAFTFYHALNGYRLYTNKLVRLIYVD